MTFDTTKPFEEMTAEEMGEVNRKLRKEQTKNKGKHPYSVPGIRLHGYLPAKMKDRFLICMDYAWKSGWLKRKNGYHFVSWGMERIIDSIEADMANNPRFSDLQDSQTELTP